MIDVTPVVPEARDIVRKAATAYITHCEPWFVGLLIHGSALKGGYIPNCSDIDFQLFLRPGAFVGKGELPWDVARRIHEDLARIDPAPFRYIQCIEWEEGWSGDGMITIPGTYHMVAGRCPKREASEEEVRASARTCLDTFDARPHFVAHGLLQHGAGRLARNVRLLCTDVWPALYNLLVVRQPDAIAIWQLTKPEAINLLEPESEIAVRMRAFDAAVRAHYPDEATVEGALAVLDTGIQALQSVKATWESMQ